MENKKIIIETSGKEYELVGGGTGHLGRGSVNSETIEDNSVLMEDLNDSIKDKIQKTYVEDDETLHMDFDVANQGAHSNLEVEEEEQP